MWLRHCSVWASVVWGIVLGPLFFSVIPLAGVRRPGQSVAIYSGSQKAHPGYAEFSLKGAE